MTQSIHSSTICMKGATFSPTSNQYALPDDIKIMYTISAFNTACTFQLLEVTMTNLTTLKQDSQYLAGSLRL